MKPGGTTSIFVGVWAAPTGSCPRPPRAFKRPEPAPVVRPAGTPLRVLECPTGCPTSEQGFVVGEEGPLAPGPYRSPPVSEWLRMPTRDH